MESYINNDELNEFKKPKITIVGNSINHIDYRKCDGTIISVNVKDKKITKIQTNGNEEEIQPNNAKETFAVTAKQIELIYKKKHEKPLSNIRLLRQKREIEAWRKRYENLELWKY